MKFAKRVSFLALLAAVVLSMPEVSSAMRGNQLAEFMLEWDKFDGNIPSYDLAKANAYMGYAEGIHDAFVGD